MQYVLRITNNGRVFKQPSFSVSNETSPIMVTHFLGKKLQKVNKSYFGSPSEKNHEKEKKKDKNTRQKIAKLLALYPKAKTSS